MEGVFGIGRIRAVCAPRNATGREEPYGGLLDGSVAILGHAYKVWEAVRISQRKQSGDFQGERYRFCV